MVAWSHAHHGGRSMQWLGFLAHGGQEAKRERERGRGQGQDVTKDMTK